MLSVEDATQKLLGYFSPTETENIPFNQSLGRTLAENILADQSYPPFNNSSMDGFALITEDIQNASPETPIRLTIIEDIPAGKRPEHHIVPGTAARIMTGAQTPEGADAVIPIEETNHYPELPADNSSVEIHSPIKIGDNIRNQGNNFSPGDLLIPQGVSIRPQDVALFAMLGKTSVQVHKKIKVGLLVTGDELVHPSTPLNPSQIRDSNSYMISSLLKKLPVEIINSGIIEDSEEKISQALHQFIKNKVDLIITSGGVSMGAYDYVRKVIETQGTLEFWRVNIKPGKPIAFGYLKNTPIIGLPGNPVSSYVGFNVFIIPILKKLAGILHSSKTMIQAKLLAQIAPNTREHYIPALLNNDLVPPTVKPVPNQGSGNLYSLVQSNSLIILPGSVEFFKEGDMVNVWIPDSANS